jgi:hypothetical protein
MDVNYGGVPPTAHVPFEFVFTLTNYYEYSITDTDKEAVVRPKAMQNQQPQREGAEIGFADAKNKIWPRTKFQIAIKRDRGFESGEYTLQIKRADDGAVLGQTIHLKFLGKNKLVDRRAIVFASPGPKGKPDAGAAAASDAAAPEKKDEPPASAEPAAAPESPPAGDEPAAPPKVEPRPGSHGCGCRLSDRPTAPWAALFAFGLGACLLAVRLRKRT